MHAGILSIKTSNANHHCILVLRVVTMMRLRDRRSPSGRYTRYYSPTAVPTSSKGTGSAARRQSMQRPGRAINRDRRELERERDQVGGEGFADLIHWQDGNAIIAFKPVLDHQYPTNHKTSTRCEPSRHTEGTTHNDIVAPRRGMRGRKTAPDDYMRNFLSSLRPSLEGKIQEFKKIGLDSKHTLDAFIRWQASERESWIFSQNPYLQLTPLELGGLMLGIERLSNGGNEA